MTTKKATAPARPGLAGSVLELIGATPLVRLNRLPRAGGATVLAKMESLNPGGSVKDRIALAMVEDAERRGVLAAQRVRHRSSHSAAVALANSRSSSARRSSSSSP